MLVLLIPTIAGSLAGALVGGLVAWWLLRRHVSPSTEPTNSPIDPFVSAEIDRAAAAWATEHGHHREAAGLLADKLHLLHRLGTRRAER